MKRKLRILFLFFAMLTLLTISKSAQAAKKLHVNTKVKNKTTVELTWKKKSVDGYDIFRANCSGEDYKCGKFKKIASVSGKKSKYVDKRLKYKKRYAYRVYGFRYKNGKKVYAYKTNPMRSNLFVCTYVWRGYWEENLHVESQTTPTSISLISGDGEGIHPSGYEVYRKESSGKWKRIATVNSNKKFPHFEYIDTDVKKGQTYRYKYRAYKKMGGKKYYGKYSDVVKLTAINLIGKYVLDTDSMVSEDTKSIVFALTSEEGNGVLHLTNAENHFMYSYITKDDQEGLYDLQIVEYSYDNSCWYTFPSEGVDFKEGEKIYVKLESVDGKKFTVLSSDAKESSLEWWLFYNKKHSILRIDFLEKTARVDLNGEYYY